MDLGRPDLAAAGHARGQPHPDGPARPDPGAAPADALSIAPLLIIACAIGVARLVSCGRMRDLGPDSLCHHGQDRRACLLGSATNGEAMAYPHPPDGPDKAETVENFAAGIEADGWERPGPWSMPALPWTRSASPEDPAMGAAGRSPQPLLGRAGQPDQWPHYPSYTPHVLHQPHSSVTPTVGFRSKAGPAAYVTAAVLVGLGLMVAVFGIGGTILLRAATTQASLAPHLGPLHQPGPAAPRTGLPGGIPPPGQAGTTGKFRAVYEVTGVGTANVSYTITEGSSVAVWKRVTLPWRMTVELDADVGEVTLGAITEGSPPDGFGCTLVVGADMTMDTVPDEVGAVNCQIRPQPDDGIVPSAHPGNA